MTSAFRTLLMAVAVYAFPTLAHSGVPDARDIAVAIDREGDTFSVTAELVVDATPQEVFAVLTDFEHMARFVSNVIESRVVGRDGDRIAVEQKSRLAFGPIELEFTNVRDVETVPFREIRSRVTEGDMEGSSFTTTIAARAARTWIGNRGSFHSNRWLPPVIDRLVLEDETRKQFQEFRIEILRRKAAATAHSGG